MAAADARRLEGSMPPSVDAGRRVLAYRVPRGGVAGITPWNWPYTMQAEVIAPALASGNAVVWVPAPTTSICAVKLADCIVAAELPAGVFNLVTGPGPRSGTRSRAAPAYWESHLPFGGRAGSKSGVGRVGGRHAMDAFTELKTVVLNLG
jgi:acyl-CoA reductase-like NAD-dependent aldehyde dehydrogenase